ncbi:MAG TPA: peptidoglycan-associated lipoprotein Pal [Acidobacteriota bacterium]|nr:peptidoglycan-associated lipoprotein Pal [Acidobacteriota bacterium]
MKRLLLVLMLGAAVIYAAGVSCGGKKEVVPEVPIDTMPVVVEDTTTPPPQPPPQPPPKPVLKESQFKTVYFDFDKFNLRADAKASLDANYALLNEFPDVIIKIEGHCDERGTIEYNLSLGEKRAKSAQDYLVGLGITAARISVISYGKERPVDAGHDETAWDKNRRCEFRIISQ